MFLRKRMPDVDIDVVELDPAVIDVAKRHFGVVEDSKLHLHAGGTDERLDDRQQGVRRQSGRFIDLRPDDLEI